MAPIGNHSFRATEITAYLANGGALEHAQAVTTHESPLATKPVTVQAKVKSSGLRFGGCVSYLTLMISRIC
jgi:hypothetical protein